MALDRLDWARDGRDWPNREASRFVNAGGLRWHVQQMGRGPALLLAHGTGASSHSWRDLMPLLAAHFTVVAPDLPGHAFTDAPSAARLSMEGMARALADLLAHLQVAPAVAVGHSAGAAILARLALDHGMYPRLLVSLNGALLPFGGAPGHLLFSPMAKLLSASSLVPRLFTWRARDPAAVQRLVRATGSRLDARGIELYGRLVRSPAHVRAVLSMMAHWNLPALQRELGRLDLPVLLVAADHDRTVPPGEARSVQALLPHAQVVMLAGLGHLAHEEQPRLVADLIVEHARSAGVAV